MNPSPVQLAPRIVQVEQGRRFGLGQAVIALTTNFGAWPAKIIKIYKKSEAYSVRFFCLPKIAYLLAENIVPFTLPNMESRAKDPHPHSRLSQAIRAALKEQRKGKGRIEVNLIAQRKVGNGDPPKKWPDPRRKVNDKKKKLAKKTIVVDLGEGYEEILIEVNKLKPYLSELEKKNQAQRLLKTLYRRDKFFNLLSKLAMSNKHTKRQESRDGSSESECLSNSEDLSANDQIGKESQQLQGSKNIKNEVLLEGEDINMDIQRNYFRYEKRNIYVQQNQEDELKLSEADQRQNYVLDQDDFYPEERQEEEIQENEQKMEGESEQVKKQQELLQPNTIFSHEGTVQYEGYAELKQEVTKTKEFLRDFVIPIYPTKIMKPLSSSKKFLLKLVQEYELLASTITFMIQSGDHSAMSESCLVTVVEEILHELISMIYKEQVREPRNISFAIGILQQIFENDLIPLLVLTKSRIFYKVAEFIKGFETVRENHNYNRTAIEYLYLKTKYSEWVETYEARCEEIGIARNIKKWTLKRLRQGQTGRFPFGALSSS